MCIDYLREYLAFLAFEHTIGNLGRVFQIMEVAQHLVTFVYEVFNY